MEWSDGTKLCNQIIVGSSIATIAEAVSFAEKSGVVDAKKPVGEEHEIMQLQRRQPQHVAAHELGLRL